MSKNRNKIKDGSPIVTFIFYIAVAFLTFITLFPMWFVFIRSVSDPIKVLVETPYLWPSGFYIGTYKSILRNNDLWIAYGYTIFYVVSGTILTLVTSVLGAYPLASKKLLGRKFVVFFLLIPMYFGGGLIPTYLLVKNLGMVDTVWAMIIPGAVAMYNIILVRTFFVSIPEAMRESAEVDGASIWTIMTKIYVPLSKPVLAVIAIYTIVAKWNDYMGAMIYQPFNTKIHPLQMYLKRLIVDMTVNLSEINAFEDIEEKYRQAFQAIQYQYAVIFFITFPIIMVYPLFQKHFVKGVMLGSLKE